MRIKKILKKNIIQEVKWMCGYAMRFWKSICAYILLGVISAVMGIGGSVASKYAIDIVISLMQKKNVTDYKILFTFIVAMLIMAFGGVLIGAFGNRISTKATLKVNQKIQQDCYEKIMNSDWEYVSDFHSGDLMNRFNNDINTVAANVINWFPSFITSVVQFLVVLAVILAYDWTMAVFAIIIAPVTLIVSRILTRKMRTYNKKMREMSSDVMQFHQESFFNIQQIKAFDLTDTFKNKLVNIQNDFIKISLDYNRFSIMTSSFMSMVALIVMYMCLGWGMYRLFYNHISYGTVILFMQLSKILSGSFSAVVSMVPAAIVATTSAGRVMELIQIPDEAENTASRDEEAANNLDITSGLTVELSNVHFAYKNGRKVLNNSSMEAKPNEVIGLIGPSGGGKTTTIRLILGLLSPQDGSCILKDAYGNRATASSFVRKYMAYVPQSNTIFSGTIAENMRVIKSDATDEEIENVLKLACAFDFVKELPQGIYSRIGEKGTGFSEGQNQRLSIARALLRDAPILVLDEATSAIDEVTAKKVLENIMASYRNRTCVLTTHKASVEALCDRVYKISEGDLKERK